MRNRLSSVFACTMALATVLALWPATAATAQSSTTRGFNAAFHLQGAALAVEGGEADTGGGAGFRVGYGVNRTVTFFLGVDGASISALNVTNVSGIWEMAHVDLGARFHFANTLRRWVPYLEVALTGRAARVGDAIVDGERAPVGENVSFNGGALTLGGGIAVYFSEQFALDVGLDVSSGQFTNVSVGAVTVGGLDVDATSSRFGVGFTYWP